MSDTELTVVEQGSDYELDWIYARYENGDGVADIARHLDKSESYVYARMRRVPEKYEDVKKIREENHNVRIRRVRGLADKIVLGYLEEVVDDSEKAASEIDRVNRIAKEYAHRVQLAEGKATENYGVNGFALKSTADCDYCFFRLSAECISARIRSANR